MRKTLKKVTSALLAMLILCSAAVVVPVHFKAELDRLLKDSIDYDTNLVYT